VKKVLKELRIRIIMWAGSRDFKKYGSGYGFRVLKLRISCGFGSKTLGFFPLIHGGANVRKVGGPEVKEEGSAQSTAGEDSEQAIQESSIPCIRWGIARLI